jgi:DNA-binding NarL/FixJ family response regulator
VLVGREAERATLTAVLADAAAGRARAVVLVGDPGVGKSALLEATTADAELLGFRVVPVAAVESERRIPGAAASLLVVGLADAVANLPEGIQNVLRAAARGAMDSRLPGCLIELLARAAEDGPLLVTADDAHCWDRESVQALAFAARRLAADDVAVLVAGRPRVLERPALAAMDRVTLGPLDEPSAVALLRSVAPDLVPDVASALAQALDGNPQALVTAPMWLDPRVRAGSAPLPVPVPVGRDVAGRWATTVPELPAATRRALAVLAAEDVGSPDVLERAWAVAGCSPDDLLPAEAAQLIRFGARGWEFPHALVRSAVFSGLTPPEQRAGHAAVATALAGTGRDACYAAHLAAATTGPDAAVADRLARVADELVAEGAVVAAAAAADQAVRVTPPGPGLTTRLLTAGTLALQALDEGRAAELAERGLALDPDPVTAARLQRVLGLAVGHQWDTRRGVALLRRSADVPDSGERLEALADALAFVKMWNDPATGLELVAEMGALDRLAPWMCLDVGTALATAGRWAEALPLVDRGLAEVDPAEPGTRETIADAWADAAAVRGLEHHTWRYREVARRLRDSGSAVQAESGLSMEVELEHAEGRWCEAEQTNDECRELSSALGRVPLFSYGTDLRLAARRGDRAAFATAEPCLRDAASAAGLDLLLANADGLAALLLVSCSEDDRALEALPRTLAAAPAGMLVTTVFPSAATSLVELLAHAGRLAEARDVVDEVVPRLMVQPSADARAYAERMRGLVADGADAETHLRAAVDLGARGMHAFEAARARLVLGQWLRRRRRRSDAVEQLAPAHAAFVAMRCEPWALRCSDELRAAGADARRASPHDPAVVLTAQERHVAEAAAEGLTNTAIARRMYLSPKTVELHLTHVYRKLGISGRAELAAAMSRPSRPASAPGHAIGARV